jgi:hypothetical protein
MPQIKESMGFYTDKKVMTNVGASKHINEYDVLSDSVSEDGTRTIIIKPADKTEHLRLVSELADKMVEKLGEGDNKLLCKMLYDTLRDYEDKEIAKMHRRVVLGKAPVKYKEGCFKLIIGDGRRKNSHEIMLVE